MSRSVWVALVLCSFAGPAAAQGLGDAARKEGEKRARSKGSTTAKTYTSDDLESGAPAASAAAVPAAAAPAAERADPVAPAAERAQGQAIPDRRSEEVRWRQRAHAVRYNVATLEQEADEADRAATWSAVDGPVDCAGNVNTRHGWDMEQLQRVRQELTAARTALEDFEEEARRAGVPPGWLR